MIITDLPATYIIIIEIPLISVGILSSACFTEVLAHSAILVSKKTIKITISGLYPILANNPELTRGKGGSETSNIG